MTSIQTLKKYFKSPGKCTDSVDTLKFESNGVNRRGTCRNGMKKYLKAQGNALTVLTLLNSNLTMLTDAALAEIA